MDIFSSLQSFAVVASNHPIHILMGLAFIIASIEAMKSNVLKESRYFSAFPMRVIGAAGFVLFAIALRIWVFFCELTGRDGLTRAGLVLNKRRRNNLKITFEHNDPALEPIKPKLDQLKNWVAKGDWQEVHDALRDADQNKTLLTNGRSAAEVYSDTVLEEILQFERISEETPHGISLEKLAEAVKPFHERYLAAENDYVPAALAAKAHLIAAWAARGEGDFRLIPKAYLNEFLSHCNAAEHIFKVFPVQKYRSPLMAATQYRLCSGSQSAAQEFQARFAIWQQLNPLDPAPYRSHGNFLLPRWFGSYEELEDCARYMMEQTKDQFGAAAYMLMYEGANIDDDIVRHMDVELFVEGAIDFAQFQGSQRAVNIALNALHDLDTTEVPNGTYLGQRVQEAIRELTSEYLVYVLPEIWEYHSLEDIRRLITRNWIDELERDAQVLYTPKGVQVIEASPT